MWVARSKTESYYYTLEYSRGSKILKKHLKKFSGILVSDGMFHTELYFVIIKNKDIQHIYNVMQNIWQENQMIKKLKPFTGNSQNYAS